MIVSMSIPISQSPNLRVHPIPSSFLLLWTFELFEGQKLCLTHCCRPNRLLGTWEHAPCPPCTFVSQGRTRFFGADRRTGGKQYHWLRGLLDAWYGSLAWGDSLESQHIRDCADICLTGKVTSLLPKVLLRAVGNTHKQVSSASALETVWCNKSFNQILIRPVPYPRWICFLICKMGMVTEDFVWHLLSAQDIWVPSPASTFPCYNSVSSWALGL